MELKAEKEKEQIAIMIKKDIETFREFVSFWLQETNPSEQGTHVENLIYHLQDEGHRNIVMCMLNEKQLKWATANDLIDFLKKIIVKNTHLLETDDYD